MNFSRAARLLALLVVAAALWRARPETAPSRVAILVLPGAPADVLSRVPAFASGSVAAPPSTTGAAFWRRLLSVEDDAAREPLTLVPLWEGIPAAVRSTGVPVRLFEVDPKASAAAFVGSSSGASVEYADLTSGRLPVPYDRAIEAVTAAAATLGKDQWSDWIRVTPAPQEPGAPAPPEAEFQVARVGDSYYLFSPAYVIGTEDVSAEPFLRGADRDQRPLLAQHVLGRAGRRDAALAALFADQAERRSVIVFEDVAEDVASVFAPDTVPASLQAEVAAFLSGVVSAVRTAVGEEGVVLVVGGPSTARPAGAAWYCILAGGSTTNGSGAGMDSGLDLGAVRATLRYLLGVQLAAAEKPLLPPAVASRFPVMGTVARPSTAPVREGVVLPWSAANLESLPGAVASGGGN